MVDHIEDHADDQVVVEVVNFSGDKKAIRQHLYAQFGAGSGGDIHTQELEHEKGLPDGGGVAFKPGADITAKLRLLEGRRIYFWKMCDPSKRKSYIFFQESKLVRIVLEHINEDYKACINRLLDYVKVQKLVEKASQKKVSKKSVPSTITQLDRSFNDDWLPSWKDLQASLIDEYRQFIKDGKFPSGKTAKHSDKLPVAFAPPGEVTCYACGIKGHKSGDASCKAGPYDVAPIAPQSFKDRKEAAKKRKASDGGKQGESKKSKNEGTKKPCFDFQKGSCRRGASCRFEHVKSDGSSKSDAPFSAKQKKAINVMLSSLVKKNFGAIAKKGKAAANKEKSVDDDSELAAMLAPFMIASYANVIPRNPVSKKVTVMATNLHDVNTTCGIDSDAGMSISTLAEDFLWLDKTPGTLSTLTAPAGINGGSSEIGGVGPMIVRAHSGEFLIDPNGFYLQGSENQPTFVSWPPNVSKPVV